MRRKNLNIRQMWKLYPILAPTKDKDITSAILSLPVEKIGEMLEVIFGSNYHTSNNDSLLSETKKILEDSKYCEFVVLLRSIPNGTN